MSAVDDRPEIVGDSRKPPQNLAAERSVLGSMMLSKDAIADVVEVVRQEHFYRPAHQLIYQAILELYGHGEPADVITVTDQLQKTGGLEQAGGAGYVTELTADLTTAVSAAYHAEIVRDQAMRRRLVTAGARIQEMGYAGEGDADDVANRAQAEIFEATQARTSEDYAVLGDILEDALSEVETIANRSGEMVGIPTGLRDLDKLTQGLQPGQMIIIAARPAIGKALALDTPVPTPTGWTTMGRVEVGDEVIGGDGCPTRVVAATEVMVDRPCYRLTFSDGSTVVADAEHLWRTVTRAPSREPVSPALAELVEVGTARVSRGRAAMPLAVNDPGADPTGVSADPQGSWPRARRMGSEGSAVATGDDPAGGVTIDLRQRALGQVRTTADIAETLRDGGWFNHAVPTAPALRLVTADLPVSPYLLGRILSGDVTVLRTIGDADWQRIADLGVIVNARIPLAYLRAGESHRRALLAGLLYGHREAPGTGSVRLELSDPRLCDDVSELAVSLGYQVSRAPGRFGTSQGCQLELSVSDRLIVAVEPIDSVPVRCIQVDRADGMFLVGRGMIPTHNSTLGLDIARSASIRNGLTSVIFSLEMSRNEIIMRMLSAEMSIQLGHIRSGKIGDREWGKIASHQGVLHEAPLFIDDSPNMTMTEIRAKCRRLKQRHDLRLIIIDYMQLMTSGKRVESRQQEVSEFSRALKLLAKELEVPVIAMSQLNRGPEQRTDKKPMLADLRESGCLTADTKVVRADTGAETTMGELYRSGARDIPVWSLDESLRYRARTMTHVFPTGHREVFEVRLRSGRVVKATDNHPLLTYRGFRAVGDLATGSRVAVPRHVPAPLDITPMDDDEIVLLAHLLGDGSFVKRRPIRYASISEENLTAVAEAAARRFGIHPIRDDYPQARVTTLRLPAPYRLARGRRNPVAQWLDQWGLFGLRSQEKFIPDAVFSAPKEQVATFIRHLWATDGCIRSTAQGAGQVYYATTSRRLADGLARLLLRFGLIARISEAVKPDNHASYHVSISGSADQKVFLRRIGGFGPKAGAAAELLAELQSVPANTDVDTVPREVWDDVRDLIAASGMSHRPLQDAMGAAYCGSSFPRPAPGSERLSSVAAVLDSAELELMATNDVFWDEIVSIRSLGHEDVFDATVTGTHNFIADGVVVHNSLEQDADMVVLIHREDFYDKENRPGEADLIVAKHRNGPTDTIAVSFQGHYSRFVDLAM